MVLLPAIDRFYHVIIIGLHLTLLKAAYHDVDRRQSRDPAIPDLP